MIEVPGPPPIAGYAVKFRPLAELLATVRETDAIITDSNVARFYPEILATPAKGHVVPAGEASKSASSYIGLVAELLDSGLRRNGTVIAVGGGVVGDLAGFAAATVHRGVAFRQVPTTLLAMVDSSVGGKVGIDLPQGKNLLGAFHNPVGVDVDPRFLRTLPAEQFASGMAEVIKYGWIWDPALLDALEREALGPDSPHLEPVIRRCIAIKRDVVAADFSEKSGLRAILNFGHTVGHALEALDGYSTLLHGPAIAIGMVAECAIARQVGLPAPEPAAVAQSLTNYGLPTAPPGPVDLERLCSLMAGDKKNIGDGLSFSLVEKPGECKLVHGIEPGAVRAALADLWN